jgi:SAM-dependent methyltransferase
VARPSRRSAWGGDKELEVGSRAHYDDPAYYTKTYERRTDDVAFYVELAKKRRANVLEYGAGNGRIAIPIARAGLRITGLDLSRPMLDDFAAKLRAEPDAVRRRVRLRLGDMRRARLHAKFGLVICPFNAFLHLYSRKEVEQFFTRVHEHLTPKGTFALDVSMPSPHEHVRDPNRPYSAPRFRDPTTGEMIRYAERFDYDPARQVMFVSMEFSPQGRSAPWVTPLAHRQFFPQELEALLHYNGFAVERVYGDFLGGKLDRYSEVMVFVCRPAAARRR